MNQEWLGKYISQIYRKINFILAPKLSKYGIGSGQYMFLIALYYKDGVIQEELSERLNMDKGTTARALKKLEEIDLVKKCKVEEDKRAYRVYLTDKATKMKEDFFVTLREIENQLIRGIEEEEVDQVTRILKRICNNQCVK